MKKRFLGMGLALLCSLTFVGCGDDDDSGGTDSGMQTPDGGGSGMTGSGGTGSGGTGTGGMGMTGTGGMAATAKPIQCGSNTCQPPAGLGSLLGPLAGAVGGLIPTPVACCLEDDACGMAAMANATCEMKATPDMRCPSIMMGAGCCTPDNKCGVDGAVFGRGCVENSEAASMISAIPLAGGLIMIPPAQACDGAPEGDAGSEQDAGN